MSTINYSISFDLASKIDALTIVNKQVFPLLHQAVDAVGQQMAINWQKGVQKAKLWQGERDAYANSITWRMTGDFTGIVEATYKYAQEIETGRPPRDLKKMLDTSMKVRRSTKGKRFLVIPMRQSMAKLQAAGLYDAAKALEASTIVGQGQRPSGEVTHLSPKTGMHPAAQQSPFLSNPKTGGPMMVNKSIYQWGGRLGAKQVGQNKWARNLYRFETSTPGGAKSSAFFTFRIMMEGQKGWVVPAQPGLYLAKKVVDDMQPKAELIFGQAISKQLSGK